MAGCPPARLAAAATAPDAPMELITISTPVASRQIHVRNLMERWHDVIEIMSCRQVLIVSVFAHDSFRISIANQSTMNMVT
jgi:hypothetical protein